MNRIRLIARAELCDAFGSLAAGSQSSPVHHERDLPTHSSAGSASRQPAAEHRIRPLQRAALALVKLYRVAISPALGPHCRFAPSCSAYMATAIERYGVLHGTGMGLRRISRCHPWHPGGYDPVK
jgi:hypothetical protein